VVGREKGCDVHIDNIGISRKHCQVERKESIYVLRDLNSGNGTFVSGRRITTHNLNNGDEIMLGKYSILFQRPESDDEGTQVLGAPKEKPKEGAVGATLQMDVDQVHAMQKERSVRVRGHLMSVAKDGTKSTTHLDRALYVIGKGPACHIRAAGWRVAPKHAVIFRDETGFRLLHVSGKGPTLLNNRSIEEERLKDGDVIDIAGNKFQFMSAQPGGH
jgi:pSer/pThr/pTyr-binding forkhead associated (FHA) protein